MSLLRILGINAGCFGDRQYYLFEGIFLSNICSLAENREQINSPPLIRYKSWFCLNRGLRLANDSANHRTKKADISVELIPVVVCNR
jgi:hypothetical protein